MMLDALSKFGLAPEGMGAYMDIFRYGCPPHEGVRHRAGKADAEDSWFAECEGGVTVPPGQETHEAVGALMPNKDIYEQDFLGVLFRIKGR
jgi:hypothetical protein